MAKLSNYLEEKLIQHAFFGNNYSSDYNSLHIALFENTTDSELEQSDFTDEISASDYDRESISSLDNAGTGLAQNPNDIQFPVATSYWGDVTAVAITDGGGNILAWDRSIPDKEVADNDAYRLPAGKLTVDLTQGSLTDYLEDKLVDHAFVDGNFTTPSGHVMALFDSTSGLEGGSTSNEIDSGTYTYQRTSVSFTSLTTDGALENNGKVEFPQAQSQWPTIVATAVLDQYGTILAYDDNPTHKTVKSGDYYVIRDGDFDFTLD